VDAEMGARTQIAITIVIGLATIAAPIAWEELRPNPRIEVQKLSESRLIRRDPGLGNLKVFYNREEISELSRLSMAIVNSGNRPFVASDFVTPIRIGFSAEAKILELKIEGDSPDNLDPIIAITSSGNEAEFWFSLFNPGDSVIFSVLIASANLDYNATARVVGLKELSVIERPEEIQVQAGPVPASVWVVGVFTLLFGFAGVAVGRNVLVHVRTRRMLKAADPATRWADTKQTYASFLDKHFPFLTAAERKKWKDSVNKLLDVPIPDSVHVTINRDLKEFADRKLQLGSVVVAFLITAYGLWYVISNL
jgi:hypothetical protein